MSRNKIDTKTIFYRMVEGDILTYGHTFGYICDQWSRDHPLLCSPKGLAEKVSKQYPHAYSYPRGDRTNFKVGDINTHLSPKDGIPTIIELYAQRYGGSAKWGLGETKARRLTWFRQCLVKVDHYLRARNIRNFTLPYMIGCGREKGIWEDYESIINDFARDGLKGEDPFQVYIIRPFSIT